MARASAPAAGAAAHRPETETVLEAPPQQVPAGIPVFALLAMTVLALVMGGFFGTLIYPAPPAAEKQHTPEPADKAGKPGFILMPLPPVTTNLAGSSRVWIRLEATLVMDASLGEKAVPLANKIAEDIVAFLRTVTPEQLEGASGFQHLREDLNDRIRIRSDGKVTDILIQTMIIE